MAIQGRPWEAVGLDEETWREEYEEWQEWQEDLLDAFGHGYLDDILGEIVVKALARRKELGVQPVKRKRTPPQGAPATPGASGTDAEQEQNRLRDMQPIGLALVPTSDSYRGYHGTIEGFDGNVYRKYDVQRAGRRFILSRGKYRGLILAVWKPNRSRAECQVLGHAANPSATAQNVAPGARITVDLTTIIQEIQNYNAKYGVETT